MHLSNFFYNFTLLMILKTKTMNTIDTRDLIEERNNLKEVILNSFKETFEHYADDTNEYEDILLDEEEVQSWKDDWEDEIQAIKEIDDLEDDVCNGEFDYGTTLIDEYDFVEYTEEFLQECGYISPDFPSWIEIDWGSTADNVKMDYAEVEFRGTTYLYR